MRKLTAAALVLLVLGGLTALALWNLNGLLNRNKDYLLAQAEGALGRKVSVGEIGVTLWGGIGVRLKDFALSDDPSFSPTDFVRAQDLQVNVEFLPLLWKEIRVKRLILHRPQITLIRDSKGRFNFASLGSSTDGKGRQEGVQSPSSPALPLLVSLVDVAGGEVAFRDQKENIHLEVSQLDFRVENLSPDRPIPLSLKAAVFAQQQNLSLQGEVGPLGPQWDWEQAPVRGEAEVDPLNVEALRQSLPQIQSYFPQGLKISGPLRAKATLAGTLAAPILSKVDLETAVWEAEKPNVKLSGRMGPLGKRTQAFLFKGHVDLGPLELGHLKNLEPLRGILPPELDVRGPLFLRAQVEGSPKELAFRGFVEATESSLQLGEQVKKPPGSPLSLSLEAQVSPPKASLQKAQIQLHKLELTGGGEARWGPTPWLNLALVSGSTELDGWQEILPLLQDYGLSGRGEVRLRVQGSLAKGQIPKLSGSLKLSQVSTRLPQLPKPLTDLEARVVFTGQGAELKESLARLGNSKLRLSAKVERLTPLTLTYRLFLPQLWLSDLWQGKLQGKEAGVLERLHSEGHLRRENGLFFYQGKLSSTQGRIAEVPYTDLQTTLSLTPQAAAVSGLSLRALGGSLKGQGRYELSQTPPSFAWTSQVQDLNLTELFRLVLSQAPQHIRGRANLDLDLAGRGRSWEEIKPSLKGQGKARVVEGALLQVNLAEGVLAGITGIPGLSLLLSPRLRAKYPEIFSTQDTDFEELRGSLTFREGKIYIEDLRIAARDYTALGEGWLDWDQRVKLRARLILSQKLSADLAQGVKEARYMANEEGRVEVPFALAGTLPRVRPQPDLAYVGKLLQRAALRRGVEELEKKVLKKVLPPAEEEPAKSPEEELLRKGLEKLFGR